jgi:16S rRNA (cytidine1402-2'-O)-methyltransferase
VTPKEIGSLYVVSTPIGHMGDFSFRAVETLRAVDLVLAEDTRHSGQLLKRYEIEAKFFAYHEHNEAKATPALVDRMLAGESMALVTDAGTPILSDPGARLVSAAIDAGIRIVPIPGASALLAALVASGLAADRFTFFGFLPRSGVERADAVAQLTGLSHTAVLYEAANRVVATLSDLEPMAGDRPAVVAREMTKQFEEVKRGTVTELRAYYESTAARGEVVILLGGGRPADVADETVRERVRALRADGMSARDTAAAVAKELGVSRRLAYQMTQEREGK